MFFSFFFFLGCDAKYFFNLIEGAWGEQPDLESSPLDEDEPTSKKFKSSSPSPSTASSTTSSLSRPPPSKHYIPPWEVGALAGIPANQRPIYETREGDKKKYYCQLCGNATGNHDSALTHVRREHLNLVLSCHYCDFFSPSFATLKKHVTDKHPGLPIQSAPPSGHQKFETTVTLPQ